MLLKVYIGENEGKVQMERVYSMRRYAIGLTDQLRASHGVTGGVGQSYARRQRKVSTESKGPPRRKGPQGREKGRKDGKKRKLQAYGGR